MPSDAAVADVTSPDVIVIGAGIIGAACALELQAHGRRVLLVDHRPPGSGVTSAGMGHLVALDETDDELDLCLLSLHRWEQYLSRKGAQAEHAPCGTLWIAEDDSQMAHATARAEKLAQRGWRASAVSSAELAVLEPSLRRGLAGGVRVPGDGAVFPPAVANELVRELVARGGTTLFGRTVVEIEGASLRFDSGERVHAGDVVVAAGTGVRRLLPDIGVFPRKGHLAITDRYPGLLSHQVVSMGYGQTGSQTAARSDRLAVAANVQPRLTGQWLVGSCRQDGIDDSAVDPVVLARVLRSAISLLPCLAGMRIVRSWTGMRPATEDGKPLIGRHPSRPGVWLAAGHEGLGVTTAFGTAQLLADLLLGRPSAIDAHIYSPARFAHAQS